MELFGDIFVAVKINLTSQEESVTRTSECDRKEMMHSQKL